MDLTSSNISNEGGKVSLETPLSTLPYSAVIKEYENSIEELDKLAISSLPASGKADISYKSSSTPIRDVFKLKIPIDLSESRVLYKFSTEENDVSFAVIFEGLDDSIEVILPAGRVDSHFEPISGAITVHKPGSIILEWDNSYSWFNTKTLSYAVSLKQPKIEVLEKKRTEKASLLVDNYTKEIEENKETVNNLTENISESEHEILKLKQQISYLQELLEKKTEERHLAKSTKDNLTQNINLKQNFIESLSLRTLPLSSLLHTLGHDETEEESQLLNQVAKSLYKNRYHENITFSNQDEEVKEKHSEL